MKNWKNDLNQNIPMLIKEHFEIYYKYHFKPSLLLNDLGFINKKFDLSRIEQRLIKQIQSLMEEKKLFKLEEIFDVNKDKNIDSIIFVLESLIKQKIIIPFNA